jgi:hypothetical protein
MHCELECETIEAVVAAVAEQAKREDLRVTIEHTESGFRVRENRDWHDSGQRACVKARSRTLLNKSTERWRLR